MFKTRKISLLTLILFAVIVIYHTYLEVSGQDILSNSSEVVIKVFNTKHSANKREYIFSQTNIYLAVIFFKFFALGSLTYFAFYTGEVYKTILMWLVGTLFVLIDSSLRIIYHSYNEFYNLQIAINLISLLFGFLIMHCLVKIFYNLVSDVQVIKL